MMIDEKRMERITWLRYECSEVIERYLHGDLDAGGMNEAVNRFSSQEEVEQLGDELLMHSFWAMKHMKHRPACWAPTRDEIEYLLVCLRDEEIFDPERVEFTYQTTPPNGDYC